LASVCKVSINTRRGAAAIVCDCLEARGGDVLTGCRLSICSLSVRIVQMRIETAQLEMISKVNLCLEFGAPHVGGGRRPDDRGDSAVYQCIIAALDIAVLAIEDRSIEPAGHRAATEVLLHA